MKIRFKQKSVLVTGGATGIGYAIAEKFAVEGANVVIVGRRKEVGQRAETQLKSQNLNVRYISGDVSDEESVNDFINQTIKYNNSIDILVNNAAMSYNMPFIEQNTEKWRKVFDVIVNGTYLCSRIVANHMISRGCKGKIINISSINAYRALEYSSHYNAAKGAMDQLTRCSALELMEHGIRVNGVNPGFIDTELSIVEGENELETDWFRSIYVDRKKIPQQRAGKPNEIAGVVTFLASEEASYICGATIPVDGGLSVTF